MTKGQRITLMADWWPRACRAQGWDAGDRDLRIKVFSEAVGRCLHTANDLNNTGDIDRVKAHLAALADHLAPVVKHETPGEDEAVRWRWVINKQIGELAEFMDADASHGAQPTPLELAQRYAAKIARDKFGLSTFDLAELDLNQLRQLQITLTRATAQKKKQQTQPF